MEYEFVDETTKTAERKRGGTSTPSSINSENSPPMIDWTTGESISATETPLSSVCSDLLDNIDPRILDD